MTHRWGDVMSDQAFRNVVNGELVDAISGETYDVRARRVAIMVD